MASFTDKISQFNPFIAELPVQEMVQVGMAKQAQYNQGVQKIQGYINNIAGMDVYNDGDKEYIQSKLNELGNNLKTVAAGDFSNQQLVNSVGGMATQIVKDPNIQNAVLNTTKFRKILAQIEKDKSEGKAAKNNIDDFYEQAKPWMESTEAGSKLNASYSPYRDVNKKAMEAIKALHPNLRSIDIPFVIKGGKIDITKIADAMKRNKVEGITEGQIETAIRAALTPEDYNQLDIDGRRTFASVPADRLVGLVDAELRRTKEENGIEIKRLEAQLPANIQDPNKTDELNKRIKYYKDQGYIIGDEVVDGDLDVQAKDDREFAIENPNLVKQSLYRQGFFRQYGNAFKWSSEDFKYEDNPLKKVEQWNENMAFEKLKERNLQNYREAQLENEKEKIRIDKEKLRLAQEEAYGTPGIPVEEGSKTDNTLKSVERLDGHMKTVADGILSRKNELIGKGYTDAQVNQMVTDYQKNGSKANIPATAIGTIQDILKETKYLEDLDKMKKQVIDEANAEVENDPAIKEKIKQQKNSVASFDNNTTLNLIAEDGTRINTTARALVEAWESGKLQSDYRDNIYIDTPAGKKIVHLEEGWFGSGKNLALKTILPKLNAHADTYGKFSNDVAAKKEAKVKEKLAPRVAELVPTITAIGFGKDKTVPTAIANNLSSFIKAADAKEIAANEDFDSDVAGSMLVGEGLKNTKVFLRQNGDIYQGVISDMTGKNKDQVINLTQSQAIAAFGSQYVDTQKQEALKLRAGRGSNNINGGPENAPLQVQYGDFPNITKYQLTAQLDEDTKYKGQFVPTVHLLKTDGTYQSFEISGKNRAQRLGYEQGKQQLSTLTDDSLMKLLKELYPTYDFSQIYRK